MNYKLAVVVSHPIQHFVSFYRALADRDEIDLIVLFASRIGIEPYFDKAMNTMIAWKMDLLGGYAQVFLPEADSIKSTTPWAVNNPSVGAELARQRPDAVLIYGYNYITSIRALLWCRRHGVPAVMISDSELKSPRPVYIKLIKRTLLPFLLSRFSAFLTVGDANEDYYAYYGVDRARLHRSPFTIDEQTYRAARSDRARLRAQVRAKLGIPGDEVVILTVGKLSTRKRPGDVIDAARKLKSTKMPVSTSFILAGDGEEMGRLRAAVESEDLPVYLPGFINVDELPGYYSAADIILHPSSRDPHPLVMSEAACIGLPLLVSDRVGAVGATDIARIGQNASVFACGEADALVSELELLVRESHRRRQMAERSQQIFEELDMCRSVIGAVSALKFCMRAK